VARRVGNHILFVAAGFSLRRFAEHASEALRLRFGVARKLKLAATDVGAILRGNSAILAYQTLATVIKRVDVVVIIQG
jgi:hypothetical protein